MEYQARPYRRGLPPKIGYYVCPTDHKVQLPDPKKLDALHYAFRMKAKYNTSLRECVRWFHSATGQLVTPSGFLGAYKNWVRERRRTNGKQIGAAFQKKQRARKKFIEENFKHFGITVNDPDDITALAEKAIREAQRKNEQAAGSAS